METQWLHEQASIFETNGWGNDQNTKYSIKMQSIKNSLPLFKLLILSGPLSPSEIRDTHNSCGHSYIPHRNPWFHASRYMYVYIKNPPIHNIIKLEAS